MRQWAEESEEDNKENLKLLHKKAEGSGYVDMKFSRRDRRVRLVFTASAILTDGYYCYLLFINVRTDSNSLCNTSRPPSWKGT